MTIGESYKRFTVIYVSKVVMTKYLKSVRI